MVAIIEVNGKHYTLQSNQSLTVDRVPFAIGKAIELKDLLTGKPVMVEVTENKLGAKVMTRRFRNKTRHHKVRGHRQPQSMLRLQTETPKKAAVKESAKSEAVKA